DGYNGLNLIIGSDSRVTCFGPTTPDARHNEGAQGTDWELRRLFVSDSQGRQWQIRREVLRSIETTNKIPRCVAPRWNQTGNETVQFALGGERRTNKTLLVALA